MAIKSGATANQLFCDAVGAEETGEIARAAQIYQELIEAHPGFAPAYVNMGTICFQQKDYAAAADYYRKATEVQPGYCLAYYNYANALEELERYDEAISAYLHSIDVNPRHRDSHYNLALAFERKGNHRKSLHHWRAYVSLDSSTSKWTKAARDEIRKLLGLAPLKVMFTNPKPTRTFKPRGTLTMIK
jgi:tetratricopeptide (TPR) repeat protein